LHVFAAGRKVNLFLIKQKEWFNLSQRMN